jgi:hypothetical protein
MKKYFLKFFFSIGFFFLIGCNNDEPNTPQDSLTNNYISQRQNLINPLEHVGIEHNLFMDEFTKNLEQSIQDGSWDNIEFLSNDYKTQFSNISNQSFYKIYPNSNSTSNGQELIYNDLRVNEWFNGDSISELDIAESVLIENASIKDKEYTMNLLNDVYNALATFDNDQEAYIELDRIIIKHENLILTQNWNSNETYALGALAIAKYSKDFWMNYDLSKLSLINNGANNKTRNPRSSVIVGADIAGYVIGGVVGGIAGIKVGVITLGAGTIAAIYAGKAVGSWIGSGAATTAISIYDAWSDFFN